MLFLSDMVTANGRLLDMRLLHICGGGVRHSRFNFPREKPTAADWRVWRRFWSKNTEAGMVLNKPLGKQKNTTHQAWEWRWDEVSDRLLR